MDVVKMKGKKNIIVRAWERCWSLGTHNKKSSGTSFAGFKKSKSWNCSTTRSSSLEEEDHRGKNKCREAPAGYFSVYVGPQRQRFVIKTEFAKHPLFKMLLEDAELEYGFNKEGPLLLPCDDDFFYKVLAEMDSGEETSPVRGFAYSPLNLCSSTPRQFSRINKGHGSYKILTQSRMLKLNSF